MEQPHHSKKLQYFMKLSVLLDRSFFTALLLICFTILALCVSLYMNAKSNASVAYTRKAQAVTVSLATLLDSYFSRVLETQDEFIEHNSMTKLDVPLKNKIDVLSEVLKSDSVKAVTLVSKDMTLLYAAPDNQAAGADLSLQSHIKYMQEHKQPLISSPFDSVLGFQAIAVMTPFFNNKSEYEGSICYLIDFESMVRSFFKDIDLREYENAWIFDQNCSMISNPGSVLLSNKRIPIDRRRLMTYALAKKNGEGSYLRVFPDSSEEEYVVCFTSIPLDGDTKWVICVEAPAEVVYKSAEGFPVVYSVPLLLFFFLVVVLMVMKRYFGRRYVNILENVIVSSRDARKEIESRLAAIMESFPYIIFETDNKGNFTFLNVAPGQISGMDAEKLQNGNIKDLLTSSSMSSFQDAFTRLLKGGHHLNHMRVGMNFGDAKETKVLSVNASPIHNEQKDIIGARGVMHDITERVDLEMNLVQSQKMDAVGMVTSGIAHDFNNYLSTMLGYITMMKMKGNSTEELNSLEKAAKNAAKLTGQLMAFSRREEKDDEAYCSDINKALSTMVDILKKSLPYSIKLNLDIEDKLPEIKATSAQIDQIVMNLVINARDAMPEGGDIKIKIWSTSLTDTYSTKLDLMPGKYVIIDISDTGKGLNEETRNRIFEPYFTTKKTGTGLGLATVYAIVKNLGGNILVKSTPDNGTQFVVYIPQAPATPNKKKRGGTAREYPAADAVDGKILIVEDDEMFSKVMSKSFETVGYKVVTAVDGKKGLQIYKKQKKSIDIIISDVIMEHMNGIDMVKAIREIDDKVPVLFITGQRVDAVLKDEMKSLRAHYLTKPFETAELVDYVNKYFTAFKEKQNDKES